MKKPPERIFLQWYGDQEPEDCDGDPSEVTWSETPIYKHDVEYRRVHPAADPDVLMRALRLAIFALYDDKLYVPTAEDPQNYIKQAIRELESEAGNGE